MYWKRSFRIWQGVARSLVIQVNISPVYCSQKLKKWRNFNTCATGMKVTICGAAGCTGQPLALLLKQCPLLDEIALYDTCATCGYGMELSHVDTKCKVSSFSGRHMLCDALKDSKVVVIVARNKCDTFENNAPVVTEIALQICNVCPEAFTLIATEPVESMVPVVSEIQRLRAVYQPRKLLGCVELNCVRANTVLADFLRVPPETVHAPVIGGASPTTMVPVLSSAIHPSAMTQEQIECVTSSIMSGNETVCAAKGSCSETACLAGAYAVARNTINVVKGLQGQKKIVQCAYVDSLGTCAPDCQFFASEARPIYSPYKIPAWFYKGNRTIWTKLPTYLLKVSNAPTRTVLLGRREQTGTRYHQVILGPSGVERNLGIPELSKFENCLLYNCLPHIRNEIARAIWLVYSMSQYSDCNSPSSCYTPCPIPCVPPTNWSCDWPDACRDQYLASICREMTCKCGSTELCWQPRPADFDKARAANIAHQMPTRGPACATCNMPRSLRIEQAIRDRTNSKQTK